MHANIATGQAVRDAGQIDNTLIITISGDDGGSAEGQAHGTPNEVAFFNSVEIQVEQQLPVIDAWGSERSYPNLAVGWTWAFGTPCQWTKQVASHFGGTRNGMAISWPRRITDRGGIRQALARTLPFAVQGDETFDVAQDTGSSVDDRDYRTPFAFTGRPESLSLTLGESTLPRAAARD
ncbi:hypothetical protein [Roseomonas sp. CECT 9278]|uniref:hypothetical protein n=1 Tax=Roseomonas sp. CECT 9278 TaxID=2845823 RepID=UPI001E38B73C|nr:hypothetical protein [Roseomonas sp. CECT 9278]CAH0299927.1 hypothetical protein ROS9278_04515 [Roseomonas sp. CECT 9278]